MDPDLVNQILNARSATVEAAGPARERIEALIDPGSLVEYGQLAGETARPDDTVPADGLVAGLGRVHGMPVLVAAYDPAVRNGTQTDRNMRKLARLLYLANRHRWPFVCFVEGDGARPDQPPTPPPIVVGTRGRWDVYEGLAEASGWTPTVAVLTGRSLDGHLGLALLCDCVIAVAGAEVGAQRDDGSVVSRPVEALAADGSVDVVVDDEAAAVATVADYLAYWGDGFATDAPSAAHDRIDRIIPDDRRAPYDVRDVIEALADDGTTLELGRRWAPSMVTTLATLGGRPIGIMANQPTSPIAGAIDSAAADKAARFVELCDAYELPIVSLIDNPGYMVGPDAERNGIARHHARPLAALHARTVPLCSVQLRKAYGLGPYAMSGWGSSRVMPEVRLAWPSVESGGMSLEGAAFLVKRKEIRAAATPEEARAIRDTYAREMRDPASGVSAGRTFSFDDVILPSETRQRIIDVLSAIPRVFPATKKHPIDPR